nr:uncharacterized protein LOC121129687 [Lepeophtheirus salmonis]
MSVSVMFTAMLLLFLRSVDILTAKELKISGIPGQDYPIYNEIPDTSFSCSDKIEAGYYADPETNCQVFHICIRDGHEGLVKASMLCPNRTIFNQELFTCDYWYNFNCENAIGFYYKNEELETAREEASVLFGNFSVSFTAIGRNANIEESSYLQ